MSRVWAGSSDTPVVLPCVALFPRTCSRVLGLALQDLTLDAEMTSDLLGNDTGYRYIASLLAVSSLDSLPLNMTPLDDNSLLLRGFYVNRSEQTNGQVGLESFLDVNLRWGVSADRPAAGGAPIAAIVAPIVVGVAVLALVAVGAVLLMRRRRAAASGSAAEAGKPAGSGKGDLLPCVYANATGCSPDNLSRNNSDTEQNRDSMILAHKDLDRLNSVVTSTASSTSKAKSGPSQDIVQAYRNMVLHKTVNEPDELVLQSVLGEGSYGKVRPDVPAMLLSGRRVGTCVRACCVHVWWRALGQLPMAR